MNHNNSIFNRVNSLFNNIHQTNHQDDDFFSFDNVFNRPTNLHTNSSLFSDILTNHLTDFFSRNEDTQNNNDEQTSNDAEQNNTDQNSDNHPLLDRINTIETRFISVTPAGSYSYSSRTSNLDNSEIHHIVTEELENMLNILFDNFRHHDHDDVTLPLTNDAINKLEEKKYSAVIIEDRPTECSICQEEYENNSDVIILPCRHFFHKECISLWLRNYHHKCPLCRQSCGEHTANLE